MNNQKVLSETTLTTLGALCLDQDFRQSFLADPLMQKIEDFGIAITDLGFADLNEIVFAESGPQEDDFVALGVVVCPKRPCLYARKPIETVFGAAIVNDDFRSDLFADPDTAPADHGFKLSRMERRLLTDLIQGSKREAIRQAMEVLADKISPPAYEAYALPKAA